MGTRKNRAREGDTQGKRERLPKRPMKILSTCFLRVGKIAIGLRKLPKGQHADDLLITGQGDTGEKDDLDHKPNLKSLS